MELVIRITILCRRGEMSIGRRAGLVKEIRDWRSEKLEIERSALRDLEVSPVFGGFPERPPLGVRPRVHQASVNFIVDDGTEQETSILRQRFCQAAEHDFVLPQNIDDGV